ncbi:MAG: hypothetical protein ABI432_18135 [Flavobacteriales bacterium]
MRTRTLTLLAALGLITAGAQAQLQRIVLQGSGAPQVFTDIAGAVAAAQSGDKLYFSGGTFTQTGDLVLDKTMHFIGAGIHPDSSNVTATTSINCTNLRITTGASGSTFTGIAFNPSGQTYYGLDDTDDDPTGIVFQRCEFKRGGIHLGNAGSTSSTTFDGCIMIATGTNQYMYGSTGETIIIRCILTNKLLSGFSRLFLKNSVIMSARLQNSDNCIVQNCVFNYNGAPLWQVDGVQISNCLVTGATMFSNSGSSSETNNIYGVPAASIFVNDADGYYQYGDDVHLAAGSLGIGAGNDGTDIGLYGTHSPYKPGVIPYNPHYQQAAIDPATNWNGELPVQIRTAVQTH